MKAATKHLIYFLINKIIQKKKVVLIITNNAHDKEKSKMDFRLFTHALSYKNDFIITCIIGSSVLVSNVSCSYDLLLKLPYDISNKIEAYHEPQLIKSIKTLYANKKTIFDNQDKKLMQDSLQFFYLWRPVSLTSKELLRKYENPEKSLLERLSHDENFLRLFHQIPTISLSTLLPDYTTDNSYYTTNTQILKVVKKDSPYIWIENLIIKFPNIDLYASSFSNHFERSISFFSLLFKNATDQLESKLDYQIDVIKYYKNYPNVFFYDPKSQGGFANELFEWYLKRKNCKYPQLYIFFSSRLWIPYFCTLIFKEHPQALAVNPKYIKNNPDTFEEFKNLFIQEEFVWIRLGKVNQKIPPLTNIQKRVMQYLIQKSLNLNYQKKVLSQLVHAFRGIAEKKRTKFRNNLIKIILTIILTFTIAILVFKNFTYHDTHFSSLYPFCKLLYHR